MPAQPLRSARCLPLLFLFCALAGLPLAEAEARTLQVAVEGNYAPFSYHDERGNLTGFDVQIAEALCREMAVTCTITAIRWDALIPSLEQGKVDMLVASMANTPERRQRVGFSDYYYQSHSVFAGRADLASDSQPATLAGLRLAIMEGTIQADYARQYYPESRLLPVKHQEEAFELLITGQADLVFSDTINLLGCLQSPEGSGYDFIGTPMLTDTLNSKAHIAVRKRDEALRTRINSALEAIRLNGIYDRINRHYFPFSIY